MSVYKPVQNYIIARNQTCAWGLSEFLPMGLAARNVVCPEWYQNRDIRFFKYVLRIYYCMAELDSSDYYSSE